MGTCLEITGDRCGEGTFEYKLNNLLVGSCREGLGHSGKLIFFGAIFSSAFFWANILVKVFNVSVRK